MPSSCRRSARTATAAAVGLLTPLVDDAIELTIGALPAGSIVAEAMAAAVRDDLPTLLLDSGYDPFGLPALRGQIAAYLTRLGVPTDPDQVLVTSGAQQALHLIGSQLGGPGTAVVMENPTYIGAIDAFRTTGNRLVPIPVDEDGARVEVIGLLGPSAPVRLVVRHPDLPEPDRRGDAGIAPTRAGAAGLANPASRSSRT